ncbi:hypothetical protein QBC39DRAFT_313809 [Podospora conica]|nr:hypothetical protein QBC39DRAFT_313809 [Schizothecium conicum]
MRPPTTLLLGLSLPLALSAPQAEPAPTPPRPWITLSPLGLPQTFTPTIHSSTTLYPPPPSLLAVAPHTLRPSPGLTTIYTGIPPIATATSPSSPAGAFLACTDYQSATAPFCAPLPGTLLHQGATYYVTWSPGNFAPARDGRTRMLEVGITWSGEGGKDGVRAGERVPAGQGFYPWRVPGDFLAARGVGELNVTFWLQEDAVETVEDEEDVRMWEGPSAVIVSGTPPAAPVEEGGKKGGVNVVAVVVPVVVGVLVAMAVGVCCWSWKRRGTVPVVGGLMKRRSTGGGGGGYGVRQSRSERVGGAGVVGGEDKAGGGIQLTDRESWSPTAGKNVFREELQRQERQR